MIKSSTQTVLRTETRPWGRHPQRGDGRTRPYLCSSSVDTVFSPSLRSVLSWGLRLSLESPVARSSPKPRCLPRTARAGVLAALRLALAMAVDGLPWPWAQSHTRKWVAVLRPRSLDLGCGQVGFGLERKSTFSEDRERVCQGVRRPWREEHGPLQEDSPGPLPVRREGRKLFLRFSVQGTSENHGAGGLLKPR